MTPAITSQQFDLLVLGLLFGPVTAVAICAWFTAWRNERQVRADMLMRKGFKAAGRLGWVRSEK